MEPRAILSLKGRWKGGIGRSAHFWVRDMPNLGVPRTLSGGSMLLTLLTTTTLPLLRARMLPRIRSGSHPLVTLCCRLLSWLPSPPLFFPCSLPPGLRLRQAEWAFIDRWLTSLWLRCQGKIPIPSPLLPSTARFRRGMLKSVLRYSLVMKVQATILTLRFY